MNLRTLASVVLLAAAVSAFGANGPKQQTILDWGDSPQGYLMTAQERAEWDMIHSASAAEKFINDYWERHGQTFHAEVAKRIQAADKFFGLGEKKGSQTERGRVFIILGAPNRQRSDRNDNVGSAMTNPETGAPNSIEQRAFMKAVWIYKPDRLPKDLNVSELTVTFQIDVNRGLDTIENPGLIEPYLKRAAEYVVAAFKPTPAAPTATQTKVAAAAAPAAPVPADDVVWGAENALNGALVTGESFISPTDKPFYAVDFYLPKDSFPTLGDVTVAGVIRDGSGHVVLSARTPAKAVQYDANGDRFVDASFEIPAGHYTGAFAIATADGKLLATSKNEFDVMPAEHVGVSKVLLTSRIDTLANQQAFDPFTFVATKYAIKGDRRFRKGDKIGFFTVVANPTAAPDPSVALKMKVSRDGKVIDNGSWMPAELSQTGPHTYLVATQFEPNSLAPGHYAIEVTLRDMKADKASDAYTKGFPGKAEFDVVQ